MAERHNNDSFNKDGFNQPNLDNMVPAARPASFDNFVRSFAPFLISLEPAESEFIKMAYLSLLKNNGQIDDKLLADTFKVDERTIRRRKDRIIGKINAVLGPDLGQTCPPSENP